MQQHLDLSAVEVFVLIASLRNFSQVAEALGLTQSGVSLKLSRLEKMLGRRLVDRTPRHVRLSAEGEEFLPRARNLLSAQESALSSDRSGGRRLTLGVSEYVAGEELPGMLALLAAHDPALVLEVKVGTSRDLLNTYDQREIDAVIVRQEHSRMDGELLFELNFGWFAAPAVLQEADDSLRLITVADARGIACIRSVALQTLKNEGIPSKDVFIGSGVPAVLAAVSAGLGVAPLPMRLAPPGVVEVGRSWKLPPLPSSKVVLYSLVKNQRTKDTLRVLADVIRGIGIRRSGHPGKRLKKTHEVPGRYRPPSRIAIIPASDSQL